MNEEKTLEYIEDFIVARSFIHQLVCAINSKMDVPNFVPALHDTYFMDELCQITMTLDSYKQQKDGE